MSENNEPKKNDKLYAVKNPLEKSSELTLVLLQMQKSGLLDAGKITQADLDRAIKRVESNYYHNTEVLLKKYRTFAEMLKHYPQDTIMTLGQDLKETDEIISALDIEMARGNSRIEALLRNYHPARNRFERLNEAIESLKNRKNGETLFDIIDYTYCRPKALKIATICEIINISRPTYFNLRKEAIGLIAERLWGAPDALTTIYFEAVELFAKMSPFSSEDSK